MLIVAGTMQACYALSPAESVHRASTACVSSRWRALEARQSRNDHLAFSLRTSLALCLALLALGKRRRSHCQNDPDSRLADGLVRGGLAGGMCDAAEKDSDPTLALGLGLGLLDSRLDLRKGTRQSLVAKGGPGFQGGWHSRGGKGRTNDATTLSG